MSEWNVLNVAEWMAALNLYQYAHVFQRHAVDGQSLLAVNHDQLQVDHHVHCVLQFVVQGAPHITSIYYRRLSVSSSSSDGGRCVCL